MNLILWIVFGALVGWLASLLADVNQPHGKSCIYVGIAGAVLVGAIVHATGHGSLNTLNLYSLLAAVVGAIAALYFYFRRFQP